jgi:hypothetical protein
MGLKRGDLDRGDRHQPPSRARIMVGSFSFADECEEVA